MFPVSCVPPRGKINGDRIFHPALHITGQDMSSVIVSVFAVVLHYMQTEYKAAGGEGEKNLKISNICTELIK